MGFLSSLMHTIRSNVQIKILPWFSDHSFEGRVVLPAVESMLLLAGAAREFRHDVNVCGMANADFSKFLEIPGYGEQLEIVIELQEEENGILRAGLFSRLQVNSFSRLVKHAAVSFGIENNELSCEEPVRFFSKHEQKPFIVSGKQIYEELVPFGHAYRNAVETRIFPHGATAQLHAPEYPLDPKTLELGSPFILDSAMHAACVWGQRFAGFVPFPVGFKSRRIVVPSQPDRDYKAEVKVVVALGTELEFDIDLYDTTGDRVEQIRGLRMRDVSGGRIKPPEWIKA